MGKIIGEGITFDDVLLVPGYSEVIPNEVDLGTKLTNKIRLNIFNSGDNIPEENIDKIFTAYFSTKESGGGTGIGLYLVRQIVENHFGGSVYCRNTENGVVFTIEMKEKDNG